MPTWKINIFKNAIMIRHNNNEGTIEDIIATYTKLSTSDKNEIISAIEGEL